MDQHLIKVVASGEIHRKVDATQRCCVDPTIYFAMPQAPYSSFFEEEETAPAVTQSGNVRLNQQ